MSKVIFVGNPGAGKSTLINCLTGGKAGFNAGLSFGSGLTRTLQYYKADDGTAYIDTPGLADELLRQQAAVEIDKVLKPGGNIKLFFVITLESGRIRPDDKTTIKLVLNAIPQIGANFGIIVNKVTQDIFLQLSSNEDQVKTLLSVLFDGIPYAPIHYCDYYSDLDDKNKATVSLKKDLLDFINDTKPYNLAPGSAKPVQQQTFAEVLQQLEVEMEQHRAENEQLKRDLADGKW